MNHGSMHYWPTGAQSLLKLATSEGTLQNNLRTWK